MSREKLYTTGGQLTDVGYHVWKQWQPVLVNEEFGTPITDIETQKWASVVLDNTVSAPEQKIYKIMEGIDKDTENPRTALMEAAVRTEGFGANGLIAEADTYSGAYSNAVGTSHQGTDTVGGIAKRLPLLFRRGMTELIAPAFMGVQPMSSNAGYVYTVKGRYRGNGQQKIALGEGFIYVLDSSVDADPNWAPDKTTLITGFSDILQGHVVQAVSTAQGIVRFREGTKVLVEHDPGSTAFDATNTLTVGNGAANGQSIHTPTALFDNEAGYKRFFENYTFGDFLPNYTDFSSGVGNTTGFSEAGVEIQEMGLTITQSRVVAQTRKLKASFPQEVQEDLQNNASLAFKGEVVSELYREMNLNQNREAVRLINNNATIVSAYDVDLDGDGRWYMEKIMNFVTQIDSQAEAIRIETRRAPGNRLLVSPLVRVALAQLDHWTQNTISGTTLSGGQAYAGNLGGKYEVFVDIFAETDYVNIAYRGDATDAGYFWCPYIGLQFAESFHPENMWDKIVGIRTRYGILENPFGTELFYRYMPVNGLSGVGVGF